MQISENFCNLLLTDVRQKFFPNEKHGYTDNKNYHQVSYIIECFSNGCLTYKQLINKLVKPLKTTKDTIIEIVTKYISFKD